jgi:DNA-binding Lrp family transcriptional regulator
VKLSELDASILRILLADGRVSFEDVAEVCGVSSNVAWKRFRLLEKRGVIGGATVQVNFADFGFDALATLLISVEAQRIDEVMGLIDRISEVRANRQYNSVFNVRAIATLKDLNELDHVKQVIKARLPILGLKTYVWTGVRNIPENLGLSDDLDGSLRQIVDRLGFRGFNRGSIKVDDLDNQIMHRLVSDGRVSFSRVALDVGVSTDTVVKHYHKLREAGSLKASIQINSSLLGYASILDFNIAFTSPDGVSSKVVEALAGIEDVVVITKTSGDYDLQVTTMVRDIPELFEIQEKVSRISGVTRIDVSARRVPGGWPTRMQYISTF